MAVETAAIELRSAESGDEDLLFEVYAGARVDELALLDWAPAAKDEFLRFQFAAQDAYYREHYAGATFDVVLLDGRPVGRLYVARWENEIRIVDIALLPLWRGRGIGTRLLTELLAEAADAGKPLTIHVERGNRAQTLYRRLGFEPVLDRSVYVLMEARP